MRLFINFIIKKKIIGMVTFITLPETTNLNPASCGTKRYILLQTGAE